MKVAPYLIFNGCCEEAFTAYAKIFGGEILAMMHFSDFAPPPEGQPAFEVPEADKRKVMHARLKIGGDVIMASDNGPGRPAVRIDGISVQVGFDTVEEARRVFDALVDGGETIMPFEATFWARGFGACRDRFGVQWMLNCD